MTSKDQLLDPALVQQCMMALCECMASELDVLSPHLFDHYRQDVERILRVALATNVPPDRYDEKGDVLRISRFTEQSAKVDAVQVRNDALEEAAVLMECGFDRGIRAKVDQCSHKRFGWEECDHCNIDAIRALKSSPVAAMPPEGK